MADKKIREAEKSPMTISFNAKEESLLKKKILALESMKKQAADSLSLDQKVLYNRFTLKLRRSELAHARLVGNKAMIKHLTNLNFNTILDAESGKELRNILKNGKPLRAASAPCRPLSMMSFKSDKDMRYVKDGQVTNRELLDFGHFKTNRKSHRPHHRFYSAPGIRQTGQKQVQIHDFREDECEHTNLIMTAPPHLQTNPTTTNEAILSDGESYTETLKIKEVPETFSITVDKAKHEMHGPENSSRVRKRSKSTTFHSVGDRDKLDLSLESKLKITSDKDMDSKNKVKLFVEKIQSLQQQDSTLKDYYSQRMLAGAKKKDISTLSDEVEEQRQWMPSGEERQQRSMTIKKLDRNFTRKDIPIDILFMEQYNSLLTKENFTVRRWFNNNPYLPATQVQLSG
ncbi:Hypothetical predicted protein [Pelobates cultripes]|uniref:Uncharacterized protein n=1 Tax=Pelobates cultripes TaxID=61616 RepID=A0AAD1R4P4_PELCU|nr:Hypothetical predicted protein [Pelobates cultripes]